uniref:Uncharacterized protein n=1 Tax=Aegilops tauschii subsp. strangulata TaxID=200361 RepID=A0A453CWT8_AEGTS
GHRLITHTSVHELERSMAGLDLGTAATRYVHQFHHLHPDLQLQQNSYAKQQHEP